MGSLCAGFVSSVVFRGRRGRSWSCSVCVNIGIAIGYVLEGSLTSLHILRLLLRFSSFCFLRLDFFLYSHMLTGVARVSPTNIRSAAGCVKVLHRSGRFCGLASSTFVLRVWVEMHVLFDFSVWNSRHDRLHAVFFWESDRLRPATRKPADSETKIIINMTVAKNPFYPKHDHTSSSSSNA